MSHKTFHRLRCLRPARGRTNPIALAAVALLADGVEHAVVSEQIYESLHVHDVALGQVVPAAEECFGVGCHCYIRLDQ